VDWWRVHGGLIRQFVRRSASIVLHRSAPRDLLVDETILTRLSCATLLAIDIHATSVDRITLYADVETESRQLRLQFVTHPECVATILLPTVVIENAAVGSHPETEPSSQQPAAVTLRTGLDPTDTSTR
jgi:hypothetical protein